MALASATPSRALEILKFSYTIPQPQSAPLTKDGHAVASCKTHDLPRPPHTALWKTNKRNPKNTDQDYSFLAAVGFVNHPGQCCEIPAELSSIWSAQEFILTNKQWQVPAVNMCNDTSGRRITWQDNCHKRPGYYIQM